MALFAYLVGDAASRQCAVVDPAFETGRILAAVKQAGFKVAHIVNTHGHADHTAGNQAIKHKTKAPLMIHRLDRGMLGNMTNSVLARMLGGKGSPPPDRLLRDGDAIHLGRHRLQVIHTPGHTPGGICLFFDGQLITGDTLFVGGVGRTDLPGGSAGQLLASIRQKIYSLPEDTCIWPGHDYGRSAWSTVAREQQTNPFTRG